MMVSADVPVPTVLLVTLFMLEVSKCKEILMTPRLLQVKLQLENLVVAVDAIVRNGKVVVTEEFAGNRPQTEKYPPVW